MTYGIPPDPIDGRAYAIDVVALRRLHWAFLIAHHYTRIAKERAMQSRVVEALG